MKRPGWLGGKDDDSDQEAGDDERPAKGDRNDGDRKPDGESAAERSARRVAARGERGERTSGARRKLAERVGKTDDESEPMTGSRSKASKPKADDAKTSKPERSKPKGDDPAKKLNRPRRQPASGKAAKEERKKDEEKPERIRARGKEDKGGGDDRDGDRKDERRRGRGDRDDKRKRAGRDAPSAGKRARAGAVSFAGALKRGAADSRKWAAANGPKAGRTLLAGLGAVFALFFEVLGFVLNLAFAALRIVARPVRAILGVLDRAARAASRRLTPARALTIVVAGAAILLALSQYADYRSISIGNGDYVDVQSLAPAPETGRLQAGDPHSYVFVPVGIACLLLLGVATIGGRWRACRLIALAGFAAIVVAILVDRPAGLDPGDAALAFEGVKAKLIGGFYAQIAAGVLLVGSSSLLARELRLSGAAERVTSRRSERGEAKEPRLRRRAAGGGTNTGTGGTARA